MKKYMLIAAAVIVGLYFGSLHATVSAAENAVETNDSSDREKKSEASSEKSDINQLQVPQKLHIVIDPWEMDGKGQIYSKIYRIKNAGNTAGVLTLSHLACEAGKKGGAVVRDDTKGLHDDKEKSVYMEMKFDNKEKIVLSQKETVYKVKLNPGEELSLSFSGEVNENASKSWKDGDIGVTVTYLWEAEEISQKEEDDSSEEAEEKIAEFEKALEGPGELEELKEAEKPENSEGTETSEGEENSSFTDGNELDEIVLSKTGQSEIIVDSWRIDGDGSICSPEYTVRNAGDTPGMFILSDLICQSEGQSEIVIQEDKEAVRTDGARSVYMELVSEDGNRILLSRENQEHVSCEAALMPGEEFTFYFQGEISGIEPEELKKGSIEVRAAYTWNLKEEAGE